MIDLTYKLKSEVCLNPGTCYPVNTEIPGWMILILLGSTGLLIKELIKLLNN